MHNHLNTDVLGGSGFLVTVCVNIEQTLTSDCFSLPGVKKPLGQYGPAGVEDTTGGAAPAKQDEDDDIDLFGSDEEEVGSMAFKDVY